MTDIQRFEDLLEEFRRVGVDPDTFSATIAVTPAEALRILRGLPDGAGPAAFLQEVRAGRAHTPPPPEARDEPRPSW
jgi:hypothetical protein